MARLSTGQAFGPTGRQTSQRLLGAAEQMATPGILAQSSINQPALQPQAAPVDLFQQTGGPTLGGPVRMFEPSPLPGPSQDMAALARALGNFSPILQTFGEQYVQRLKTQDERAKLIGQQFAADLRAKYPGEQLVELRDRLYRQAQAGDATAAEAYNKVQALSPLQLAYANRYNELALTRDSINSAVGRFAQLSDIEGTPLDQIPPGDPRLKAAQTSLIRPTSDPVVFAELAPEIERKYAEMDRDHATAHRAFKTRQAATASKKELNSEFTAQLIDRAGVAARLSNMLTNTRVGLGVEDYQKHLEKFSAWIADAALAGSMKDGRRDVNRFTYLANEAIQIFREIRVGPNGETLLIDQLGAKGGVPALLQLQTQLMERHKTFMEPIEYLAKESGEEKGRMLAAQYRIGDPTQTPAQALVSKTQALQAVSQLPQEQQGAAIEEIERQSKAVEMIGAGQQKLVESSYQFDYSKDPASEIAKLESLKRSMLISGSFADRTIQRYRELQSEDQRPYVNAAKEGKKILMEQELDAMKRPGSEDDMALSDGERQRLIQRSAEISADIEAIRRSGMANNLTPAQLRKELDAYFKEQTQKTQAAPAARITTPPAYDSPQKWSDSLGFFGRMGPGNRGANYTLQQQVKNRALFPKNVYDENFKRFLTTGELSDPLRLMIKRAGYQNKPAQFFVDQWRHVHGDGVPIPQELEGRIQELNNLKVSFAQPVQSRTLQTYAAFSNALDTTLRAALDVAAPPAMAAPMPTTMAVRGPVNINRLRQAIIQKESGGDFSAVNPDSGAIGIGQVMPENVGPWTQKHLGRRLTPAQFRNNRAAQIAVVNGQLNEILQQQLRAGYDPATAIRRTASIWYSGRGDLYNNPKPQFSGGQRYPSIRDYTLDILRRYSGR